MNESTTPVQVERWPTEIPLLVLVALSAAAIWILLAVSIIGAVYAAMLGAFFFFGHVAFIAYVRGNAVKLGPEQFPQLHDRVRALAARVGLRRVPDAYIMQAGGSLNALATKFFRSDFIVLFSDLLDACGDNTQARDMIVAHELGHLKAGHLRGMWFLLPGMIVPFLGTAWSRAREYTADRYGFVVCEDKASAMVGLSILAAGGKHGPRVNLRALAAQRGDLDTGLMTLGHWLATHPPLTHRVVALDPQILPGMRVGQRGAARALVGLMLFGALVAATIIFVIGKILPTFREAMEQAQAAARPAGQPMSPEQQEAYEALAMNGMRQLAAFLDAHRVHSPLPADPNTLNQLWLETKGEEDFPFDPFDGMWYGYQVDGDDYVLWSLGADPVSVEDDIIYDSTLGQFR